MRRKKRKGVDAKGRSKGDGQFMPIPYTMARSEAFRSLNGNALKVFIELRCRYDGRNNGELSLSFQNAADLLGMGKSTVKRAFDELIEKGFVIRKREGHWYGRRAAEYIVTDSKFDGQAGTRDWQRWKPSRELKKQNSVPRRHDKGACVPSQDRASKFACRNSTRQQHLTVIDGAASGPPLLSCEGADRAENTKRKVEL